MVSVAVFLGNGLNAVSRNSTADTNLEWESYAGWLAFAAGIVQLMTVLGFDSLFRSQQSDAPPWKRAAFRGVLTLVLGLPVIAALHWVAGEDVSRHTAERVPDLKFGDVRTDGRRAFAGVLRDLGRTPTGRPGPTIKTVQAAARASRSTARLRTALVGPPGQEKHLTDPNAWPDRIKTVYGGLAGAALPGPAGKDGDRDRNADDASWKALCTWAKTCDAGAAPGGGTATWSDRVDALQAAEADRQSATWAAYTTALEVERAVWATLLEEVNGRRPGKPGPLVWLADPALTKALVAQVRRHADGPPADASANGRKDKAPPVPEPDDPSTLSDAKREGTARDWIADRAAEFGGRDGSELKLFWDLATRHGLDEPGGAGDDFFKLPRPPEDQARFNHLLLSALYHSLLKAPNDPSTSLVVLPDQRFRWGLLVFTGAFATALLLGWVDFNRHSPSFQFYKDGVRRVFLLVCGLPEKDGLKVDADPLLSDLKPWEVGLPMPLYVATLNARQARLKYGPALPDPGPDGGGEPDDPGADYRLGRAVTRHPAFVFSPLACGGPEVRMQATAGYAGGRLRLSDAVTASGSAVSPYFIDHAWLTWFMTASNLRLGVWLPRPGDYDEPAAREPAAGAAGPRGAAGAKPEPTRAEKFDRARAAVRRTRLTPGKGSWLRRGVRWAFGVPGAFVRGYRGEPDLPARLPAAGALPVLREWLSIFRRNAADDYRWAFVADGGFRDNLGAEQLLRRRCGLIVVSDAGYNHGNSEFTALANLVTLARAELGVEFFDLDAERPLDLDRFVKNADRLAPQQVLALRVRYPDRPATPARGGRPGLPAEPPREGLLVYAQMALTGREDMGLRQAREQFPNFPDEPTGNQVYSAKQVALYRRLGAHVGAILCRNLPPAETAGQRERVLSFADLKERLTLAYLQECGTEGAVADGESSAGRTLGLIGSEAIELTRAENPARTGLPEDATYFPADREVARRLALPVPPDAPAGRAEAADRWLALYDRDADFRLYHDRRAWRLMRGGEDVPRVPRDDPGGVAGSLCPGHVAVLYMTCARRADLDPPRGDDGREKGDREKGDRGGGDWQPFAAGGRKALMSLVAREFGDRGVRGSLEDFLKPLRHHVRECEWLSEEEIAAGIQAETGVIVPGGKPESFRYDRELKSPSGRVDFPTPKGVHPVQRFLIDVAESVAPERDAKQIKDDLAVCLHREAAAAFGDAPPAGPPGDRDGALSEAESEPREAEVAA